MGGEGVWGVGLVESDDGRKAPVDARRTWHDDRDAVPGATGEGWGG